MPPKKSKAKLPLRGQAEVDLGRSFPVIPLPSLPTRNRITSHNASNDPAVSTLVSLSIFDDSSNSTPPTCSVSPPKNLADDPFGVTDPYGVKESHPVVDRGELWYIIDDPNRREAGRREWREAQQTDPTARAEELYPEAPDQFAVSYSEWSRRRIDELLKHREARHCGLLKDKDIYDAIRAGPAVIEQLRDRERRYILDREGIPPKRPIVTEDLDILYDSYVKLLGAPGHRVPGCDKCKKASGQSKLYSYTLIKMTREGGKWDEQWHYPSKKEANGVERACNTFLRVLVGFAKQEKQAIENASTIAQNIERGKVGKDPIPLNETRVEKLVREIEEGTRPSPPIEDDDSESETEDSAAQTWEKDLRASQEAVQRTRLADEKQRTKIAWQRYRSETLFLQQHGGASSASSNLEERPFSHFSDFHPVGLAYKGKLIHDKTELAAEDWERLKENPAAFEQEQGRSLPAEGEEREKWDRYIDGVLEEYKPPSAILTRESKGSQ